MLLRSDGFVISLIAKSPTRTADAELRTELGEALVSKHTQSRMANKKYLPRTAIAALRTLGYYDMREKAPEPKAVKSRCYPVSL